MSQVHPSTTATAPNTVVGSAADAVNHPKEVPPVKVSPQKASTQRHPPPSQPNMQQAQSSNYQANPHQQHQQHQPVQHQNAPPPSNKRSWNPLAKKPLTLTQYDAKIQKHQNQSDIARDKAESAAGRRNQNTATLHNSQAPFSQRFTSFFKRINNWSAEKRHHRSQHSEEKKVRRMTNERNKHSGQPPHAAN
jgi:hypothetical protein